MDKKSTRKGPARIKSDVSTNVRFDDRGNAIWRWDPTNSGASEDTDKTYNLLKSLDTDALQLEDSKIIRGKAPGNDPYNSPGKARKK